MQRVLSSWPIVCLVRPVVNLQVRRSWSSSSRVTAAATFLFVFFLGLCVHVSSTAADAENITIGYLTSLRGLNKPQGLSISGALSYAIEQINDDDNILPNHTLRLIWNNTDGERLTGIKALTEQWKSGAIAFFGPEDSCHVEAHIAAAWNLPMLSYKCVDSTVSDKALFPTFARFNPPDNQVLKSVIALLHFHKWMKFTIIYEENDISTRWKVVSDRLQEVARINNISVNEVHHFKNDMPCCDNMLLVNLVEKSCKNTRVYIFLGETKFLVRMMRALQKKNLLEHGDYIVIYVDLEEYNAKDAYRYVWESLEYPTIKDNEYEYFDTARSVLVVAPTPPVSSDFSGFVQRTREYNGKEPFSFPDGDVPITGMRKHVGAAAIYLYDSVQRYAQALNSVLNKNKGDPQGHLNGTAIIAEMVSQKRFKSISGLFINIDANGDAEGNFSVLALVDEASTVNNWTFLYSMRPVGMFKHGDVLPEFELLPGKSINWKGGKRPADEPACGFDGSRCILKPDKNREIVVVVLSCILAVVSVTAVISYRNWKYEQEIAGLLWKIYLKELLIHPRGAFSSLSKTSVVSQQSLESRVVCQWFMSSDLELGSYKGTTVVMKSLRFIKKLLDVPRETKKEMRRMKEIRHDNINPFIGACLEPNQIYVITEYCGKGSLVDILGNDNIKLDPVLIASLVWDLIKAMTFIHDSDMKVHGNLKTSNCVVTSRWVLKVTDFGLHDLKRQAERSDPEVYREYWGKLWTAPEMLREPESYYRGSQKGDIYAFAIILFEIFGRQGPYLDEQIQKLTPQGIVYNVQCPSGEDVYRPDTSTLVCQDYIIACMRDCWHEKPDVRPDFRHIHNRLKPIREGMKPDIIDNMLDIMENYANRLELTVEERTAELVEEKKKTEALLHRMLPQPVAEALMRGEYVTPESFDAVTIYFSDIVGFTEMSAQSTPMEVVTFLNSLYTVFDNTISNYDVYKVETIGDAYMVVSGLPLRNSQRHAGEIASMALDLLAAVKTFTIPHRTDETLKLRIGIHTGPVVAGVVGKTMPRYCLFGDTVNTASRMESNGEALMIHISPDCKYHLDKLGGYVIVERGVMHIKGKGEMTTYWLVSHVDNGSRDTQEVIVQPRPFPRRLEADCSKRRSPQNLGEIRNYNLMTRRFSSIPRSSETELGTSSGIGGGSSAGGLLSFLQSPSGIPPVSFSAIQSELPIPAGVSSSCRGRKSRSPVRVRSLMVRSSRRDKGSSDDVHIRTPPVLLTNGCCEGDGNVEPDWPRMEYTSLSEEPMQIDASSVINNNHAGHSLKHIGNGNIPVAAAAAAAATTCHPLRVPPFRGTGYFVSGRSDLDVVIAPFDKDRDVTVRLLSKNVGFRERPTARHLSEKDVNGKRWRSCDEIGRTTQKINFKNLFSGLFNNREAVISNGSSNEEDTAVDDDDDVVVKGIIASPCNIDIESAM